MPSPGSAPAPAAQAGASVRRSPRTLRQTSKPSGLPGRRQQKQTLPQASRHGAALVKPDSTEAASAADAAAAAAAFVAAETPAGIDASMQDSDWDVMEASLKPIQQEQSCTDKSWLSHLSVDTVYDVLRIHAACRSMPDRSCTDLFDFS